MATYTTGRTQIISGTVNGTSTATALTVIFSTSASPPNTFFDVTFQIFRTSAGSPTSFSAAKLTIFDGTNTSFIYFDGLVQVKDASNNLYATVALKLGPGVTCSYTGVAATNTLNWTGVSFTNYPT